MHGERPLPRRRQLMARRVLKAEGYPTRAAGTVLLALARLEDQDGFFALAHQLEEQVGADALENSPWYLLAPHDLAVQNKQDAPGDARAA